MLAGELTFDLLFRNILRQIEITGLTAPRKGCQKEEHQNKDV